MKYAIVTVNHKYTDDKYTAVDKRMLLIEYQTIFIEENPNAKRYGFRQYRSVRVVEKDPYFKNGGEHNLKYEFPEDEDVMIVHDCRHDQEIINYRPYYSIPEGTENDLIFRQDAYLYRPNEFEANSDEDAKLRFMLEH